MNRLRAMILTATLGLGICSTSSVEAFAADGPVLPAGTRLYLALDEIVSSARGGDDVGTVVRCHVWRDVESGGFTFIKAGAPSTCRVNKVSRRNIGGFEGKVVVGGVETKSVDDQTVTLAGGYNKDGDGHKVLVIGAGLLFWPVLFVPGGNAELPPGTVFDVSTVNDVKMTPATVAVAPRTIDLRALGGGLSAQFMLDDFMAQPKQSIFRIKISKDGDLPRGLVIDSVNGKPIEAIPLAVKSSGTKDGEALGIAEVEAKTLAKHFSKGINRFEVSYNDAGEHKSTEVVMDVQM